MVADKIIPATLDFDRMKLDNATLEVKIMIKLTDIIRLVASESGIFCKV